MTDFPNGSKPELIAWFDAQVLEAKKQADGARARLACLPEDKPPHKREYVEREVEWREHCLERVSAMRDEATRLVVAERDRNTGRGFLRRFARVVPA